MANRDLKIKVNQALHGYQNGHQLLAASTNLSLAAKRTLLFQSDLSGSMESGFESYITGYPIKESNIYVFARTWYAPEMERPGCVWTHSLLLEFSDIGKMPDLSLLNFLFKRPQNSIYDSYSSQIDFDALEIPFSEKEKPSGVNLKMKAIMKSLYQSPDDTIIIPQNTSSLLEDDILQIWNRQWPRLRRNFTFCSGALNLKLLDEEEYDLQVIPERLISTINRQSKKGSVVDFDASEFDKWLNIFKKFEQQEIHQFLWTFGADVEGKRVNYIPLLKLFQSLHSSEFSLTEVNDYINEYFPGSDKGKFLKKNIYGANSILPVPEKELVDFLLSNDNNASLNYNELQLSERIIDLINKGELSVDEFVDFFRKLDHSGIDNTFWEKINLPLDFVLHLIETNTDLIPVLIKRWPKITEDMRLWRLSYSVQREILYSLQDSDANWKNILEAVINSTSKIILDFRRMLGESVTSYSLQLINAGNGDALNEEWVEYIIMNDEAFYDWVLENKASLKRPIFVLIFIHLNSKQIEHLRLDAKTLVNGYELVKIGATKDFINVASCKLLAVGYNDALKASYVLIERTFPIIYSEVCSNRIGNSIWKYISKENVIRDYNDFFNPLAVFTYFQKSKRSNFEVEYWDNGRHLIVKTVNQFINNNWPVRSYVATFSGKKEFKEAFSYCYTFEKGTKLIKKFMYEIEQGRIKLNPDQIQTLKKILS